MTFYADALGWVTHVVSDSADFRHTTLGGSVSHTPEDSPYGRSATLADPGGVAFKVMGPDVG